MKLDFEDRKTGGQFTALINDHSLKGAGISNGNRETTNTIVWNTGPVQVAEIDQVPYTFPANSVMALVANQHFVFEHPEELVAWQFNREFYCIVDHDVEVGCAGFLFYGICHPLIISLTEEDLKGILLLKTLCVEDMIVKDRMQGEMLRTLLKRMIINVTRIAKKSTEKLSKFTEDKIDLVRRFNLLVEANFRSEHQVRYYAEALHRSPKTLANLFAIVDYPAPSKLIRRRIILEAKRYLHYTEMSAKEIAYALGFTSPAHFSHFFKTHSGNNTSLTRFNSVEYK